MIKVKNLHKYNRDQHVLKGINLEIHYGEVVVLIGDKSAGKSTLLRCLNYVEGKDVGEIIFNGIELNNIREEIGIVFARFNLFPHKTVVENVIETPTIIQNEGKERAIAKGMSMLKKVGLNNMAYVYPKKLSNSQKQRVAIARALMSHPKVLLFDEPTVSVEPECVDDVLQVIRQLTEEGMTMVIATDELDFAREIADKIVFLTGGEVVEEGDPEKFFKGPSTVKAQRFLEKSWRKEKSEP